MDGNLTSFNGVTGKLIKDSGKAPPAGTIEDTAGSQAKVDTHAALSATHGRTNIDGVAERDAAISTHNSNVTDSHGRVAGVLPLGQIPTPLTGKDADTVDGSHAAAFAPAAKGVTNGDSHDHVGGDGAAIVEAAITLADNITNDLSITRHGLAPKAPNDTAKYLRGDATWGVPPGAGAADYPMKLKPALTRWGLPGWGWTSDINIAITSGRIYYIPIFVSETTTYIRIGLNVNVTGAGTADLRIFAWANGVPGALILSAGTVDLSTTGDKEIVISQQLTRGYYFLAMRSNVAFTAGYAPSVTAIAKCPVAGFNTSQVGPRFLVLTADGVYADPPPAPTAGDSLSYAALKLREN